MESNKIIHQIWITDNNIEPPKFIQEKIHNVKTIYSDYQHILWNDISIKEFLKENFDEGVTIAYELLKPYSYKSDLARFCLLYHFGGYYIDSAICPEVKFEPEEPVIFKSISDKEAFGDYDISLNTIMYDAGFLFFKNPKHPVLKETINLAVDNILSLQYNETPLFVCSGGMFGKLHESLNMKNVLFGQTKYVEKGVRAFTFNGEIICFFKNSGIRKDLSKMGASGTNDYETLWLNYNIYDAKYINLYYDKLNITQLEIKLNTPDDRYHSLKILKKLKDDGCEFNFNINRENKMFSVKKGKV
jgi:hypothetical protein